MNKNVVIGIIVVVVLALGAGGYFLTTGKKSSTSQPTANTTPAANKAQTSPSSNSSQATKTYKDACVILTSAKLSELTGFASTTATSKASNIGGTTCDYKHTETAVIAYGSFQVGDPKYAIPKNGFTNPVDIPGVGEQAYYSLQDTTLNLVVVKNGTYTYFNGVNDKTISASQATALAQYIATQL